MEVIAFDHRFFAVGGSIPGVVADAGRSGWFEVAPLVAEGVEMVGPVDGRGVSFPNGVLRMPPPLPEYVVVVVVVDESGRLVDGVEIVELLVVAGEVDERGVVSFPNGLLPEDDESGGVERVCIVDCVGGSRCCCCFCCAGC